MNKIFYYIISVLFILLILYNNENFESCKIINCNTNFILDTTLNICKPDIFIQKAKDTIKKYYDDINISKKLYFKMTIYQIKKVDDTNIYVAYTRDNGVQIYPHIALFKYTLNNQIITINSFTTTNITENISGLKLPIIKNINNCVFNKDIAMREAQEYFIKYFNNKYSSNSTGMIPIQVDNIKDNTFNVLYEYFDPYRSPTHGKEIGIFSYYYFLNCTIHITSFIYNVLCFSKYLTGIEYINCKYDEDKAIYSINRYYYKSNNIPYILEIYKLYKINNSTLDFSYGILDNVTNKLLNTSKAQVKYNINFDGDFIVNSITYDIQSIYV